VRPGYIVDNHYTPTKGATESDLNRHRDDNRRRVDGRLGASRIHRAVDAIT